MEDITTVKNEIIEGVGNTVTKRLTDEFKDKYMSKEEANGIKDEVKELRENMEKRLNGGFGRVDKQDREEMKPFINYYFLKNILKLDDVPNTKAIAPTGGGVLLDLIPTEISAMLIEKLNTYSLLRQNCTIYPGDKGIVYAEATAATAARMTTRGTAVAEGTPTYTPVSYSTVGMQSWVTIDNKVVRESPARILDWATTILVKSFAALEYTEFITGSGTNSFEGLNSCGCSTSTPAAHTTIADLDATDTEPWFRALPAAYRMAGLSATWVIGGTALATKLASLNAASKEYWNANVSPETWHGRRYWEHASVTTSGTGHPVGYFGDLSYFYIFDKLGQMLRRTDVGYNLTLNDQTLLALYGETDGKVVLTDAFYSLTLHAAG